MRYPYTMEWREGPNGQPDPPIRWKCGLCPMAGSATTVTTAESAALRHLRKMHAVPGVLVDADEPLPPEDD